MITFSTCATCQKLLDHVGSNVHPNCAPPADPIADLDAMYREHLLAGRFAEADALEPVINAPATPNLAAAAKRYAAQGWPVFPLKPGEKVPATRNGFKDATTDRDVIAKWWTEQPKANIGLPTGVAFDVIDVDAPAGWWSYFDMVDADGIPPVHGIVATAGAGLHLYVQPMGEGNRAGILPGIDYRGAGGYVVAPPSLRADGAPYTWRVSPSPLIAKKAA